MQYIRRIEGYDRGVYGQPEIFNVDTLPEKDWLRIAFEEGLLIEAVCKTSSGHNIMYKRVEE